MQIDEVSEILGLCHFLRAPSHIFITSEPVFEEKHGMRTYFRGLQPKSKGDSIFLPLHADDTTPIHEAVHAVTGLDEFGTEIITRSIIRKNQIMEQFPLLRQITKKKISYQKVESSEEYPWAHQEKYRDRVQHFILTGVE